MRRDQYREPIENKLRLRVVILAEPIIELQLSIRVARSGLIISARFRTLESNKEAWKLGRNHHLLFGLIQLNDGCHPSVFCRLERRIPAPT